MGAESLSSQWECGVGGAESLSSQGTRHDRGERMEQRVLVPKGPDLIEDWGGAESLSSQGTRPEREQGWRRES